jgi:hypothetical protein
MRSPKTITKKKESTENPQLTSGRHQAEAQSGWVQIQEAQELPVKETDEPSRWSRSTRAEETATEKSTKEKELDCRIHRRRKPEE